jgi:hypothetical protein
LKRRNDAAKWAARRLQYMPDIARPKSFNEKVIYKKLYDRNPLLSLTTDKLKVKDWVIKKLGESINIIPTVWFGKQLDIPTDFIDNYIVKPNHMSGKYHIVKNGEVDLVELSDKCDSWMSKKWAQDREEWAYAEIDPFIMIEPLLLNEDGSVAKDYKFHMFHGKCELVYVDSERENGIKRSCYTSDWEKLDITITGRENGPDLECPRKFEAMLQIAEILSADFDFVRVDLYYVDDKIYFGELTHYPASGSGPIEPVEFDYKLGEKW